MSEGDLMKDLAGLSSNAQPAKAKRLDIQLLQAMNAKSGDLVTIKLIGSLDTSTAPELEQALAPVTAGGTKEVVFDLTDLKFVTSAGLRIFSSIRKVCKERGGQAAFVNMQPQIKEVFEIIRALPGVAIFKNIAEFDTYLTNRQRSYGNR